MSARTVLVTGATGKQGKGVVDALSPAAAQGSFKILALTRSPDSGTAQKLAQRPGVELIQGDFNDTNAIFEKAGGKGKVWGVFCVSLVGGENEFTQGKNLIDSSLKNGVEKFVFTSVDRHGEDSDNNPTGVPHFKTKHEIEKYLRQKAGTQMGWTILRPTAFMENFQPNFFGKAMGAMWAVGLPKDKKLQWVATKDIGVFGAKAFMDPDGPDFKNKCVSLAGDDLTWGEANRAFQEVLGQDMPKTFGFLGTAMLWGIKEMGTMMKFWDKTGYGANVAECRRIHPEILTFKAWLQENKDVWTKK